MAKIPVFQQEIFGSGAGFEQIAVFGSLFAAAPAFATDAPTAQSLSNWLTGWFAAAIGGNAPAIEDMNAPFFVITTQLAYLQQAGVPEYLSGVPYYTGSFVQVAGVLYVSLTDNNIGNAVTDTTNWKRYGGGITPISTSTTLAITAEMVEVDASGGANTQTLPSASASGSKGKKMTITKMDTSTNQVTVTDGTFIQLLSVQYDSVTVFCNGSIWYAV